MKMDTPELDERIAKCERILAADPQSQIFAALADAYRRKGATDKAMEICLEGLGKHPDYAPAYVVAARIYFDQGNYIEAERHLQKAIAFGGRTRSIDLLESEVLIKTGEKDKARKILERLYGSDPHSETIRNLLALAKDEAPKVPSGKAATGSPSWTRVSSAQVEQKKSYSLSHALGVIKVLPRVLGVVAVTRDGMVVEGQFDGFLSRDELGALAAGAFAVIASSTARINFGQPEEILVEADQSKLWLCNRGHLVIVISTRDDVNLGSFRLKINEILKHTEF